MINQKSLAAVAKGTFSKSFCRPLYDSYCFSRIPQTVAALLGGSRKGALPVDTYIQDEYDGVVLFLVDGFGWKFFESYASKYPFLNRFAQEGIGSKITSEFPSTTAAHVTSLNTGLEVGQTGVYEWFYYEPILDRMIAPLLFSYAGDHRPGTLADEGIDPKHLYPKTTWFQHLAQMGITSCVLQQEGIAHSPYSQTLLQGAQRQGFKTLDQALDLLVRKCLQPMAKKFYNYLYFGDIDAMGHRHGIDSPQFNQAIETCWSKFEELFIKKVRGKKNIALLVIADHGMVPVNPQTTFYLNQKLPEILPMIKKNGKGDVLAPAGSCRDFFLHIEEKHLDKAHRLLQERLSKMAEVYRIEELIQHGFFGSKPPSKTFMSRVGDLVILPYEGEAVWWYEKHRFEQHFFAAHGGLTRSEMETIFLFSKV